MGTRRRNGWQAQTMDYNSPTYQQAWGYAHAREYGHPVDFRPDHFAKAVIEARQIAPFRSMHDLYADFLAHVERFGTPELSSPSE